MLHFLTSFLEKAEWYLAGPLFITLLLGTGLFYTLYLRVPQIRYCKRSIAVLFRKQATQGKGDTSIWQALATSLGGSIGVGSIVGVAMAIHIGGPSSIFWMWVTALVGMATKLVEVIVGHRYRQESADGTMVGGPMYYMKNHLRKPWLGHIFAFGTLVSAFLSGNMPQVNSMTQVLAFHWGIPKVGAGLVITLLAGIVVIGGIRHIGKVAEWMVPLMSIVYLGLVVLIIAAHADQILPSLHRMVSDAFRPTPAIGGFLGASVPAMLHYGINYGFFTNDAGMGTAGIAHAASKEKSPKQMGIIAMIEPFLSTCVMCTLTALAILTSGCWQKKIPHAFDPTTITVLAGDYRDSSSELQGHLSDKQPLPRFSGTLAIQEGRIKQASQVTVLHTRSVAEEVTLTKDKVPFSGSISINEGKIILLPAGTTIKGLSLTRGADLALNAFQSGPWKGLCALLFILCLLLFAFSTVLSYAYFGDRALVYLGGEKYLLLYRLLYIVCIFIGAVTQATVVWQCALISGAMMAIPNLVSLLMGYKVIGDLTTPDKK